MQPRSIQLSHWYARYNNMTLSRSLCLMVFVSFSRIATLFFVLIDSSFLSLMQPSVDDIHHHTVARHSVHSNWSFSNPLYYMGVVMVLVVAIAVVRRVPKLLPKRST